MISDFACRVIAQQAIRGRTLAGAKVLNSPMVSLKEMMDANSDFSPVITVFSSDHSNDTVGQDTQAGATKAILSFTCLVPPSARFTVDGREYEVKGQGPFAAAVSDIMVFQILQALRDSKNPWARLWSDMVPKIGRLSKSPPFLEVEESIQVPSRMLTVEYTPLADPVAGRPLTATWQALYDLMMEDAGLRVVAPLMKTAIEQPGEVPDWAYIVMQLGLSDAAATATGVRPLDPEAPHMQQVGTYEDEPGDGPQPIVLE